MMPMIRLRRGRFGVPGHARCGGSCFLGYHEAEGIDGGCRYLQKVRRLDVIWVDKMARAKNKREGFGGDTSIVLEAGY